MGAAAMRSMKAMALLARRTGPYLLLELLMPGGTLLALLLFLYQRQRWNLRPLRPRVWALVERALDHLRDWQPLPMRPAAVRVHACGRASCGCARRY